MLGVSEYPQEYIDQCRADMRSQLAAYRKLKKTVDGDAALGAFEPLFFNNLVLALDAYFVHRLRTKELKDGNPANEVRVLCESILHNGAKLAADKAIKLKPDASVLGYEVGDEISLDEKRFAKLADAYFVEIEKKYT
jgi:hypothetical protein